VRVERKNKMQFYTDTKRESDPHSLPDAEVFQLTATEAAAYDEDLVYEYSKRHEFRFCSMNGKIREAMMDAIVEEQGITGGWFYWYCSPGCLPDSTQVGPFGSQKEAIDDARKNI